MRSILVLSCLCFVALSFILLLYTFYVHVDTGVIISPKITTEATTGIADDPAIWIHPTNPAKSVIVGSDKLEGIYVWNLNGKLLQHIPLGTRLNNIDVRYGFTLGGRTVDILAGNLRDVGKIAVFIFDPDYDEGNILVKIADKDSSNNDIQKGSYGFTLYKRPTDGAMFVFEMPKKVERPKLRQYHIEDDGTGRGITVTLVRTLNYTGGAAEGFVADDELGFVYMTGENEGIYKFFADPSQSSHALAFFAMGDGTKDEREGLALYKCNDGTGYLILSNQGADNYKVYERQGNNTFVKTLLPTDEEGRADLATDGLDVTSASVPGLPCGFLVGHDDPGSKFQVYDWAEIAKNDLTICPNGIKAKR